MAGKRARKTKKTFTSLLKSDSFYNSTTGLNVYGKDKRLEGVPVVYDYLSRQDFESMWRGSDLGSRIIEGPTDEMMRKPWTVHVKNDPELTEAINGACDDLKVHESFQQALNMARAFGGAGILMAVEDASNLDKILDVEKTAPKSIKALTVFDNQELVADSNQFNEDPTAGAAFGMPIRYRLYNRIGRQTGLSIHESRLLKFDGVPVVRERRYSNNGWGDSIFLRCYETVRDFSMTWGSVSALMQDFQQSIFTLNGLNELILSGNVDLIQERVATIQYARSVFNAVLLDAGNGTDEPAETFDRKVSSLAGISDILEQFMLRLASAAQMPVSLFFGQAPAGLNATGDSDLRWYYDRIAAMQRRMIKPQLERFLEVLFSTREGPTGGEIPENWSIVFPPLWQLDELQEATRRKTIADTDAIYIDRSVIPQEQLAVARFGGEQYSAELKLDPEIYETPETEATASGEVSEEAFPMSKAVDPTTALNGAQVTALLEILEAIAQERIPRDSGVSVIASAFPLTAEEAERLVGSIGKGFKPKPQEPPGGAFGGKPGFGGGKPKPGKEDPKGGAFGKPAKKKEE